MRISSTMLFAGHVVLLLEFFFMGPTNFSVLFMTTPYLLRRCWTCASSSWFYSNHVLPVFSCQTMEAKEDILEDLEITVDDSLHQLSLDSLKNKKLLLIQFQLCLMLKS